MNRVLQAGLQRAGHDVDECRAEAWGRFVHQALATRNPLRLLALACRVARAWVTLTWRFCRLDDSPDWIIVGYPGFFDVRLARRLARGRPIALVSFISLYDTIVADRQRVRPDGLTARLLRYVDRAAFQSADAVLVDTDVQGRYYAELFGLDGTLFVRSFVGEDDVEYPFRPQGNRGAEPLRVLFFGTYVPLHGIDTIIGAAHELRHDEGIRLRFIGNGQMFAELRELARVLEVDAEFISDWIAPNELVEHIEKSHVCLGVFGTTAKAARVIPYKVFDAAAVGRAIITRDSPAIREMFHHGVSALLCPAGDASALAAAIRQLRDDEGLRLSLAQAAHDVYRLHGCPEAVGGDLAQTLALRNTAE